MAKSNSVPESIQFKGNEHKVAYQEYMGNDMIRYCISNQIEMLNRGEIYPKTTFIERYITEETYIQQCKLKEELLQKFKDYRYHNILQVLSLDSFQKDDEERKIMYKRYWYSLDFNTEEDLKCPTTLNIVVGIDQLLCVLEILWDHKIYIPNLTNGQLSCNRDDEIEIVDECELDISFDIREIVDVDSFEGKGENRSYFIHKKYANCVNAVHGLPEDTPIKNKMINQYAICIAEIIWETFFPMLGSLPKMTLWKYSDITLENYYGKMVELHDKPTRLESSDVLDIITLVDSLIKSPKITFSAIRNCFKEPILNLIEKHSRQIRVHLPQTCSSVTHSLFRAGILRFKSTDTSSTESIDEQNWGR